MGFRPGITPVYPEVKLPPIKGQWYHVYPGVVSNGGAPGDGLTLQRPLLSIYTAYNKMLPGDGCILYGDAASTARNTSYLSAVLAWSKNDLTVFGAEAPIRQFGRTRVSNTSTVLTLPNLITLSGANNRFYNVSMLNSGSDAAAIGCLNIVAGVRNYFENCHLVGAGHATPAALIGANSLSLTGAEENCFKHCTFGTDTVDSVGDTAAGVIYFGVGNMRNDFEDCHFVFKRTAGSHTAHGFVRAVSTGDSIERNQWFRNCTFEAYVDGLPTTTPPASWLVGTAPNNGLFVLFNCGMIGCAAWDPTATNDRVWVLSGAAAAATGGIGAIAS